MSAQRIAIVTSSTCVEREDTLLWKSIEDTPGGIDFHHIHNPGIHGIAAVYNRYLDLLDGENEIVIFAHDDVSIQDRHLEAKLQQAVGGDSAFAITGPAGLQKCHIAERNLWHLMSVNGRPFHSASGAVAHYGIDPVTGKPDFGEVTVSAYGPTPRPVMLLDGLFLAVNLPKVREQGLRFDENYPSRFHFYDLDFCLEANLRRLRMTTWPLWLIHRSHGLAEASDPEWLAGNQYFIQKWREKLPRN